MHTHLPGDVTEHHVPVFKLDAEGGIREILCDLSLHLNDIVLCHFSAPSSGLEIGLLEQGVVLLGHHVVLHLGHEVHGDDHDDQQRGAAEVERDVELSDKHHGQHAHGGDVERAPQGKPRENSVQVLLGLLSGADAPCRPGSV